MHSKFQASQGCLETLCLKKNKAIDKQAKKAFQLRFALGEESYTLSVARFQMASQP